MKMNILVIVVLSAIFLLGAVPGCLATDRYVPCGGPTPCYATIQWAVNNASAYDTIYVAAGTYTEQVKIPAGKDYLRLVGHSSSDTTVQWGSGAVIQTKSPVIIQGFHITTTDDTTGIQIRASGNGTNPGIIQDNKIDDLGVGIGFVDGYQYWEIKHNEITDCNSGIYFESASHILVSGNTFSNCEAGCGGIAGDDVQIVRNNFAGSTISGSHAIGFCSGVPTNLLISHNEITGHIFGIWAKNCLVGSAFVQGTVDGQGTVVDGVKVTCNNIEGNDCFGILNEGSCELNAENNWWGDPSGPSHSPGSGDPVSANVDFEPWLTYPFQQCPECGGLAPLPAFSTLGVFSLIGVLSVVLAVAILRKRE
jgi:parallel beta-helix repeat protein